ncbi:urease accessory protein UreD [Streptosporangium sp. NPDC051023]|uniref:urease accessory protein UreD n=1 Tax=Streptosporangium sp. NPDC051023 TaxID=3155410 RepID=UPI00344FEEE5
MNGAGPVNGTARVIPVDRLAPARYTIDRIPDAVAGYAAVPDTLPVGSPGKVGVLELEFGRTERRTELTGHYQKTPLQIMRPLYYDERRPEMAYVMLMTAGGGVVQGDRYRMDFTCGPGTEVNLTTQAATKIYKMEQDYATQLVTVTAGPGSYVEYVPHATIPFARSRFYQRVRLVADPSATVVLGESLLVGRLARGERNDYDAYCADLEASRPGGETLFADTVRLVPSEGGVTGPAVLDGFGVMATLFVVTGAVPAPVVADTLHEALAGHVSRASPSLRAGASVLPRDCGAWVRILGEESPEVEAALRGVWDAVRRLLIGAPVPARRRP